MGRPIKGWETEPEPPVGELPTGLGHMGGHGTLGVGLAYAITIIIILAVVSRL